jgi:hypothetical protein
LRNFESPAKIATIDPVVSFRPHGINLNKSPQILDASRSVSTGGA